MRQDHHTPDHCDITDWEPNKRDVNTVFQNYALFPHMNVADNVGYGLKIRKVPKADCEEAIEYSASLDSLALRYLPELLQEQGKEARRIPNYW